MTWFAKVFGFEEPVVANPRDVKSSWKQAKDHFKYDPTTGILTASPDGEGEVKTFQAGFFETPSLESLREKTEELRAGYDQDGTVRLSVVQSTGDVSVLHTLPENRFAVFQAASQFNTLEHTSERGTPGLGIACYARDRTQGPACAIACAPGTVVRNYMQEGADERDCKVNTLAAVDMYIREQLQQNEKDDLPLFKVFNGYTMSSDKALTQLNTGISAGLFDQEEIKKRLMIGVQRNTQVVCSKFGADVPEEDTKEQIVTQAYCSAISVSYSGLSEELWEPFARLILESLYEQTLHVALLNRRPYECDGKLDEASRGAQKVFLTAVGGGVFGNKMSWIAEAIGKALDKFKHAPLEVVLVSFRAPSAEFTRFEEQYPPRGNESPETPEAA